MSALRQKSYDTAAILFPIVVALVFCSIIHGIAQGWQ